MIKYSSAPTGLSALVENIKTKEKFAVSTLCNPCGVYETAVCRAPNLWIAVFKGFFLRFVFVVNSSTSQQAEQTHIRTAELFEQLNPKDLIKKYKIEGRIGMQLFVSGEDRKESQLSNEQRVEPVEKEITDLSKKWARFALDQLFSDKWDKLQKELYVQMKEYMLGVSVSEQSFLVEMLGAQLELLGLVAVHTNLDLGITVAILLQQEYFKKLPSEIQESVKEACKYCNNKVAEYGKKGFSGYDAIANACAERLNLGAYSKFAQMLAVEFEALGETWRKDLGQYRFDSIGVKRSSIWIRIKETMETFWFYFWRVVFIVFFVGLISSGILGIIIPHRSLVSGAGEYMSKSEWQIVPAHVKLLIFGWSLFQILLGSWFLFRLPLKKDKIISVIFIIFFVLFYYFVVAPTAK